MDACSISMYVCVSVFVFVPDSAFSMVNERFGFYDENWLLKSEYEEHVLMAVHKKRAEWRTRNIRILKYAINLHP